MPRDQRKPGHRAPYFRNYKLYPHEVRRIRALRAKGTPLSWLAAYTAMSISHMGNICQHRFWREVE